MAKLTVRLKQHIRLIVQLCFTALTNGYARGFTEGTIYTGPLKNLCVPGLNCYSCPGALGSCPLGSLQSALATPGSRVPLYLIGFFLLVGSILGRFVCGWLCPFGLIQDLLYKIPFFKKRKSLPGHHILKWVKYVILAGFVIILPLFALDAYGVGAPYFCKYICPSGTLTAGVPLALLNKGIRSSIGWLFAWKGTILAVLIIMSLWVYRPFCKYLCPLGAIYGFFNPIAFRRYKIDKTACTKCGVCRKVCKMDIDVCEKPNSMECIRCGECKKKCPHRAIR